MLYCALSMKQSIAVLLCMRASGSGNKLFLPLQRILINISFVFVNI
jgi:hypothetical protein